jgi:hypothetical protein
VGCRCCHDQKNSEIAGIDRISAIVIRPAVAGGFAACTILIRTTHVGEQAERVLRCGAQRKLVRSVAVIAAAIDEGCHCQVPRTALRRRHRATVAVVTGSVL